MTNTSLIRKPYDTPPGNKARPRVAVVIVTFLAVSALASPMLGLLQRATGLNETVLQLTQFSTALGALAVWLIWRDRLPYPRATQRSLLTSAATAVGMSLAIVFILVVVSLAEPRRWPVLHPATLPAPLALIVVVQFVGAAGEEIGWRGLVQPALQTLMSPLPAAAVTGALFGLGHFYVFSAGIAVYAVFVVSAVGLSLAASLVTTGYGWRTRVLAATILHWIVNIGILIGFSNGDESLLWIADTAIAMVLVGAACIPRLCVATGTADTPVPNA